LATLAFAKNAFFPELFNCAANFSPAETSISINETAAPSSAAS